MTIEKKDGLETINKQVSRRYKRGLGAGLNPTRLNESLAQIKSFKEILVELEGSDLLIENFSRAVDRDGKSVLEVSTGDVLACMGMAAAFGIDPVVGLSLGKLFTKEGFMKASSAQAMGLDPLTGMKLFNAIPDSKGGVKIELGVQGMNIQALKAGIICELIEDYVPVPFYVTLKGNVYLGTVIDPKQFLVINLPTDKSTQAETDALQKVIDDAKIANRTLCLIGGITRRTTMTATRYKPDGSTYSITRHYELQEAIEAGLAKGTTVAGEDVKGKANWTNPKDMMSPRVQGRCLKLIGADTTQGTPLEGDVVDAIAYEVGDTELT